ncbi:MAG: hypothetical protein R3C18_04530 [Planctomycetaceae bacterium]
MNESRDVLQKGDIVEMLLPGERIVEVWVLHLTGGNTNGYGILVPLPDGRILGPYYVRESTGFSLLCRTVAHRDVREAIPLFAFHEFRHGVYIDGQFYGRGEPFGPQYAAVSLNSLLVDVVAELVNAVQTMWGRPARDEVTIDSVTEWLTMVRNLSTICG